MNAFAARSVMPMAAVAMFCVYVWGAAQNPAAAASEQWIASALRAIDSPIHEAQNWQYIMNAKIRLLLFWKGSNDVGAGEIVKGTIASEPSSKVIKLLIGSDPLKAPRKINYWGSAIELQRREETAFFGFKKVSKGRSSEEVEKETQTRVVFPFDAYLSYANSAEFVSRAASVASPQDFTFREFDMARPAILKAVTSNEGTVRRLEAQRTGCSKTTGFLEAVDRLVERAIERTRERATECYVYKARYYTITLAKNADVPEKQVRFRLRNGTLFERNYTGLTLAKFEVLNTESRERTRFDLLLGTGGDLRGVPVQIEYQPNWWFRVILDLQTKGPGQH